MAATVVVVELNGGSNGSPGSFTTLNTNANGTSRYCNWDNPCIQSLANPCIVPNSNFGYSFWKHHALNLSGTYTQVSNIRWYTDGAIAWNYGTNANAGLRVGQRASGDNGCPTANYTLPGGTVANGANFYDASVGHPYFKSGVGATPTYAQNWLAGSPLTIDTGTYGPNASATSKAVVTQVWLSTDATQGVQTADTVTFIWAGESPSRISGTKSEVVLNVAVSWTKIPPFLRSR
jgi:hypothetical protein